MTNNKGILIKNVYYMLTYAFKELRQNHYEQIAGESFENIHDLFAEILCKGIAYLLKQGLHREYIAVSEQLATLRGKLDLQGTIRQQVAQRQRLACVHDELSENNLFNQIIKAAVELLLSHSDVNGRRKHTLRRLMLFFDGVESAAPADIPWSRLRYDRNSRTYQMLHGLCYFLLKSQLLTTEEGQVKMAQFSDEHMNLLFQRFVLEYYRRHHKNFNACAKQIKWDLESSDSLSSAMLPVMQSDITLSLGERTLIIDTKYYSRILQSNFEKVTLRSPHIYQIHSYVTNEDRNHTGRVDGLLLYALTEEGAVPFSAHTHDGNILMAQTLNLNVDFVEIKRQLEALVRYAVE